MIDKISGVEDKGDNHVNDDNNGKMTPVSATTCGGGGGGSSEDGSLIPPKDYNTNIKKKKRFDIPKNNKAKTPLNLNRHALLFLYCIVTFLTGCTYWGWNGIQDMLYKSGAFLWVCDGDVPLKTRAGDIFYPDCPNRQNSINNLYTTAFASHFIFSLFGGIFLDSAGPKLCIIMGQFFGVLGWGLIAASSQSINAYYAGAAFLGLSADPGYLPMLSASKLYPGNESLIMSIMGSIRSCSFAMPVILSSIYNGSSNMVETDFWKICVGYIGVALGLSFLISIFFIPNKPFYDENEENNISDVNQDQLSLKHIENSNQSNTNEKQRSSQYKTDKNNQYELEIMSSNDISNSNKISTTTTNNTQVLSFKKTLLQPEFLLIVPFFCFCLLRSEFYTKSNKEQLVTSDGRDVYNAFSILNILSFLPGPLFGKLTDKFGILFVIKILNITGILMYISITFDSIVGKSISITFYFIYTSFVLSNLYCYVGVNFPAKHFGKLAGLASMIGGAFTLTSIGWYHLSSTVLPAYIPPPKNFIVVNCIMILLGLLNIPIWLVMWRVAKKKKVPTATLR